MGKINRVIFLFGTKFTKRDYQRFGIDIIMKRGYSVEVWDFTPWWKPNYSKLYTPPDLFNFKNIKYFYKKEEINTALARLSDNDVIIDNWKIYLQGNFKRIENVKIGSYLVNIAPNDIIGKNYIDYILEIFSNPIKLINFIKRKIFNYLNILPHMDFIITGGKLAFKSIDNNGSKDIKIIKAHAFDYDLFLDQKNNLNVSYINDNSSCTVFLDEDVPNHPDYLHLGIKPDCNSDVYYQELNLFFNDFKNRTGMNVVVAAHPRSNYDDAENPFINLDLIYGRTISLVQKADFVFGHISTSMNYAILYNKPIVFLDSNNYSLRLRKWINEKAVTLDSTIINLSEATEINFNNLIINKNKYNEYKDNYIKESSTPEKPIASILCDYLTKLNE